MPVGMAQKFNFLIQLEVYVVISLTNCLLDQDNITPTSWGYAILVELTDFLILLKSALAQL